MRYHLRPAVQKVGSTVANRQSMALFLLAGLPQKFEGAAIIQFPYQPILWKDPRVSDGRTGTVFAQAGRVDDHRAWRQSRQAFIFASEVGVQHILNVNIAFDLRMSAPHVVQSFFPDVHRVNWASQSAGFSASAKDTLMATAAPSLPKHNTCVSVRPKQPGCNRPGPAR